VNWNFITNRIATGGALSGIADVDALIAAGITDVIDCEIEQNDAPLFAQRPQINYVFNGVADDGQSKPASWFAKSLEFALMVFGDIPTSVEMRVSGKCRKIYTHCAQGLNRGPSTAYCILRALGATHDEAKAVIILHRPQCLAGLRYVPDADAAIQTLGYE
jgi:hypothetical protein